jgi:hypothetical protein
MSLCMYWSSLERYNGVDDRIQLSLKATLNIICTRGLQRPQLRYNTLFVTVISEGTSLEPVH